MNSKYQNKNHSFTFDRSRAKGKMVSTPDMPCCNFLKNIKDPSIKYRSTTFSENLQLKIIVAYCTKASRKEE